MKQTPVVSLLGMTLGALFAAASVQAQTVPMSMVSLNNSGLPPSSTGVDSSAYWQPAMTPDGRYVAFASGSNFIPGVNNNQVYLRDRQAGTLELISQSSAGVPEDGNTINGVSISNDGCRVVFISYATNLVPNDINATGSIFVRNRCTNPQTTEMVDVLPNGSPGTAQGLEARISGDGSKVVFTSYTPNLVPGLLNGSGQVCSDGVYVRDLNAQTTSALTVPISGACVSGRMPDISADGSRIAFYSHTAYVPADTNGIWDIYLYDFATPAAPFTLVSADSAGTPQRQGDGVHVCEGASSVTAPAISQNGRIVSFRSRGYGLVSGVPCDGRSQVYVKEISSGAIIVASVDNNGVLGNADSQAGGTRPGISGDGQFVVFNTSATNLASATGGVWPNVVMHDNFRPRTFGFSNQSISGFPEISGDPLGRYVTFWAGSALDPNFTSRGYFMTDRYKWLNFADVPANHWALTYINAIYDMGITTGCATPGHYCPAQNVTREQMAAFIIRAVEGEPAACISAPFSDVQPGGTFCKYIQRMKDLNITIGCGNGKYCPASNVTRQEMAAFIIRAVEGEPAACTSVPFLDVPTTNLFCGHIKRMKDLNITTGCGGGSYCPNGLVTRDQMAAFLARAFLGM